VGGRADRDDARSHFLDIDARHSSIRAETMKTLTCTADTPILTGANSTHVFSHISNNSALISHLSRHVSWQVGE